MPKTEQTKQTKQTKRVVVRFNEDYFRATGFNVPADWDNNKIAEFLDEKYPGR